MTNKETKLRFTLRLPKWLDKEISKEAEHNGFSKNAYILMILRERKERK